MPGPLSLGQRLRLAQGRAEYSEKGEQKGDEQDAVQGGAALGELVTASHDAPP